MNDAVTPANEDLPGALKGSALLDAIAVEAIKQGVRLESLYERFDLAETYWLAIIAGNRSLQVMAKHRLKLVADFLDRPLVEVMTLAEFLEPSDFVVRSTIDDQLNLAYNTIRSDLTWATLCPQPEDWDRTPIPTKILTVTLYERVFGMALLEKAKLYAVEHVAPEVPVTPARKPARAKRKGTALAV